MLISYLTIAIRHLLRNKIFSVINVAGMAVGLACCLIIALFITSELRYDRFHSNYNRLYRIISGPHQQSNPTLASTPSPWAPLLASDFPSIENYVRMLKDNRSLVGTTRNQKLYENDIFFSDSSFFSCFRFQPGEGESRPSR